MRRGFTLLEMTIVLALVAVIVGGGLVVLTGSLRSSQVNLTVARMDAIEKALLDYSVANTRIPCPGDLTVVAGAANYGLEAGAGAGSSILTGTGVCAGAGMLPQANAVASSGAAEGAVPVRSLRLADDYMYDGWGRHIRYAVNPAKTVTGAFPASTPSACQPTTGAIQINDAAGSSRTGNAAYVLLSHGANGHGAYSGNGVIINASSSNSDEQANCHCTSAAAASTYTANYVQKITTDSTTGALATFDDIVSYKQDWQMVAPQNANLKTGQCVYAVDNAHNRIEVFDLMGNYSFQFGTGGTGDGQFSYPSGIAIDPAGNVYVGDYVSGTSRIQKFNAYGTFLSKFTTANPFGAPTGIAIDPSGNIYVNESYIPKIEKYDKTGTLITSWGSAGNGSGQFNVTSTPGLFGIALDATGNVYAAELSSNARVQKFDASGTFLLAWGSYGSGATQFAYPSGIVADSSNIIYVSDMYNSQVKKFDASGNYLGSIGSNCVAYGGSGCFYNVGYLALDASNNVFVVDANDTKIVKFDPAGNYLLTFGSSGTGTGQFGNMFAGGLAIGR